MARGEEIPVNPQIIAWARKRAGFSDEEATRKFPKIAAWEAGEALPSYPQLELMAEAFRVPIAVFFFPQPPDVPPIGETFRTLPDTEFEQLPRRIQQLLRKAKAFQLGLYELCQGRNPADRLITSEVEFTARMSVDTMAARVRSYLGVSLEQQSAWRTAEDALKQWRDALYRVGIFVFKDAFREESFSGFSLYDDVFPIIYVNNSQAETRQIFTLFHELAHLLFHTSGIDPLDDEYIERLHDRPQHIEMLCNRFAAQFLVPEKAVPRFQQNIEQKKLLRGGKVADPFVIARAACEDRTVVTVEVMKPNAVKIPNICAHFGVRCLSLPEFMEAEGWTF
jgi:Zn-dependent peptidase ImmA (M78 family)/transcriptional regulator with XRE-family HTH domain